MSIFKAKENEKPLSLEEQMKIVAKKHGITLSELKKLAEGKSCPKYGTKELLHVRKVRGNNLNALKKFKNGGSVKTRYQSVIPDS